MMIHPKCLNLIINKVKRWNAIPSHFLSHQQHIKCTNRRNLELMLNNLENKYRK